MYQDPFLQSLLANEHQGEQFAVITAVLKQVYAVCLLHSNWGQNLAMFSKASHISRVTLGANGITEPLPIQSTSKNAAGKQDFSRTRGPCHLLPRSLPAALHLLLAQQM